MQEAMALALDFLDEHPSEAVRILEQNDPRRVAALLQEIPVSYSELVMSLALPAFAAHLCRAMGAESSARLLLESKVTRMVDVLRHLESDMVEAILLECPQSRRQSCQLLMYYPLNAVGAWMVPNTAVVSSAFSVAEVLDFLKDATEETFSKYVFIVDRDGIPQGRASYLSLLKAEPGDSVSRVMEHSVQTLSGRMPLAQAAQLPCWHDSDVMPVTGQQHQFIGVLRHADLRRGQRQLNQQQRPDRQAAAGDPVAGIADAYGKSLLALFETVSSVIESGQRR